MSHTVEIKTQVRDPVAVQAACSRLKLPAPVQGKHKLFSEEVTGLGVQLPGWKYPVVCELGIGSVITFRFQELTDGGIPRFPSFVRVRTDAVSV